jgi:D-glycero-D-manno-heptose 1,7-bisphosphate phosphatase
MAPINSALPQRRPALFLDRDGVLIENKSDYVRSVGEAIPLAGAFEALGHLRRHRPEHLVIVVTNQAGIGKGIITHATVEAIHAHLARWARAAGGRIDAFYTCPERNDEPQRCRKPAPGMLLRAAREWSIDLSRSVMVGDAVTDVQAGLAAGVAPLLVRTGRGAHEAGRLAAAGLGAVPVVPDVAAAIERVIALSPDP